MNRLGDPHRIISHHVQRKPWNWDSGIGEEQSLLMLVARRFGGMCRNPLELDSFGDERGDDRGIIVDADDSVDRRFAGKLVDVVGCALGILEIECEQSGGIRLFERAGLL